MPDTTENDALFQAAIRPLRMSAIVIVLLLLVVGIWSVTAHLATTIRANGTLVSANQGVDIQHPYGGAILQADAILHHGVKTGQKLYVLDVSKQRENLQQIETQTAQIIEENAVLQLFLSDDPSGASSVMSGALYARYKARFDQVNHQVAQSEISAGSAVQQRISTQNEIAALEQQLEVAIAQERQRLLLTNKGLATQSQSDELRKQVLAIRANIHSKQTELIALEEKIETAQYQVQQLRQNFRIELLTQLTSNQARLPELTRGAITLRHEIAQAEITAPVDGFLVEVNYQSSGMFIGRGQTIAKIAQPLDSPVVRLIIPTQAIEQTYVGMLGTLTISSLPQRNLSKISAELVSISPDALKDETGATLGYSATAQINDQELQAALASVGTPLNLSADMPVSLALEGRQTTFYDYIAAPFFKIFSGALQD
ncbi:HlyD family type I secretion periplasmic adaptor subunit [Amylibacter marinus]|uniref:HlyD family type I secretion periplasmic adaptor subunit n=1 Tax=Amylibacter marinus TaxID=1475483 RepID=A0ABQ5VR85_9RHOB|nr:HlyD family efflux transporter periplasmic adaptor subunit [Amylibacter marinus]GLQ33764.1 HlyD family type I secretion periplasmic adaptor subunit [Amylibacter marinus]